MTNSAIQDQKKEWSIQHKIILFSYAPFIQIATWIYAKYWMSPVNTDNGFEVLYGMLIGYSPYYLIPLWAFSLFLLFFTRPVAKEEEKESDPNWN